MEKGKVQTEKVQKEKIKKEKAQKGKMEKGISWLIQTGLSLYLILLGVILPFYYGDSYENLGSLKTVFYLRAGGVLAAAAVLAVFLQAVKMKKHFLARNFESEKISDENFINYVRIINKKMDEDEIRRLKVKLKEELDVNKKIEIAAKITEIKKRSV